MPEYVFTVHIGGTGRLKVRADAEAQAREDAPQMAIEDIEWDSYGIEVADLQEGEQS